MPKSQELQLFVEREREGTYFLFPFTMPPNVERLTLRYQYQRHHERETRTGSMSFVSRQEVNIIDLGLISPGGIQVGASGSDKNEISVSETEATPGYKPCRLEPGEWNILVGAYKVAAEGVIVSYELTFTEKRMRLYKGDLHVHTLASDGVLTAEELGWQAARHGLDFLAITDHNQMSTSDTLPRIAGVTMIPGIEWTHYQGHANFLGVDCPYDEPFFTNSFAEAQARFKSARERGALITINHPFEEGCGFQLDMNALPFDCLEIWNGPMRESNLRAIGLWQSLLATGKKIPICAGSDYHRDTPFIFLGGPTTFVYAMSLSTSDILYALRQGHAFLSFAPNGPTLEMTAGEAMLGDTVPWPQVQEIQVSVDCLQAGDVVRMITNRGADNLVEAQAPGRFRATYPMPSAGFARVEVLRAFVPGLPLLPALISNPVYFRASGN